MGTYENRTDATLAYYTAHATNYAERTDAIDVSPFYARFDPLLKPGSIVLDLGCGGGRDAKHFAHLGHQVIGADPCLPLLKEAQRRVPEAAHGRISLIVGAVPKLPLNNRCCSAIWACASLLHLPRSEMPLALAEFCRILVRGGVFAISVKRGTGEHFAGGRWFTYWELDAVKLALEGVGFAILHAEAVPSVDGGETTWLYVIAESPHG